MKKFLHLSPRILGIIYILFISLFALDVFTMESSVPPLYISIMFLIHFLPSIVFTILLIIAWRYEKIGGILFIVSGGILTILLGNSLSLSLILITLPIVIGILFLLGRKYRTV